MIDMEIECESRCDQGFLLIRTNNQIKPGKMRLRAEDCLKARFQSLYYVDLLKSNQTNIAIDTRSTWECVVSLLSEWKKSVSRFKQL